ncbi:hypothetical protein [Streptomyces sp. NPDC047928]|uniref:hypothetical protein n=1 Tax=unclassified Streptomyces TaxID=2593676 RepID=UPI0037149667
MNGEDRKAAEVRRLLADAPRPRVPPDLLPRAVADGVRALRRARLRHLVLWALLTVSMVAFVVWAALTDPWPEPAPPTTPRFEEF